MTRRDMVDGHSGDGVGLDLVDLEVFSCLFDSVISGLCRR